MEFLPFSRHGGFLGSDFLLHESEVFELMIRFEVEWSQSDLFGVFNQECFFHGLNLGSGFFSVFLQVESHVIEIFVRGEVELFRVLFVNN